ncbi:MAG: hypothetical protein ABIA59_01275 [Candidatus Latescibacterota bacterium]
MDQQGFEKKLDEVTEKFSKTVSDGVKRVEDTFEKGKERFENNPEAMDRWKSFVISPSGGVILIIFGILWLLYTLGVFNHPVFPILLIITGLYLIFKKRPE